MARYAQHMTDFEDWLAHVTGGASHRRIAEACGFQNTALSRWIRTDSIPAERVIEIARRYHAGVFDGLRAAGIMTPEDLVGADSPVTVSLSTASDKELAAELTRRLVRREDREAEQRADLEEIVERMVNERLSSESD